jgi:hypothetical protein
VEGPEQDDVIHPPKLPEQGLHFILTDGPMDAGKEQLQGKGEGRGRVGVWVIRV